MNRLANITGHLRTGMPSAQVSASPVAATKKPVVVTLTGGAGNIAYAMIFPIGQGRLLGPDQPIELRLLEIPQAIKALEGVVMEINDGAFPLITKVVATSDYKTAFEGTDIALLVGAKPRSADMVRADLLKANAAIFAGQGKALNQYASRDVKVLVVGNPANTNALIASHNAPDLPARNFHAMTRLDENRAISQIATRTGAPTGAIKNVVIWGNHSATQYPDVNHAYIVGANGQKTPVKQAVNDDKWLTETFIPTVQKRGGAIIKARGKSSAASAGNAALDHIRSWVLGTAPGEYASFATISNGEYGVPKGIIFSFPVTAGNGEFKIVEGLPIDQDSRDRINKSAAELLEEKKAALGQ